MVGVNEGYTVYSNAMSRMLSSLWRDQPKFPSGITFNFCVRVLIIVEVPNPASPESELNARCGRADDAPVRWNLASATLERKFP